MMPQPSEDDPSRSESIAVQNRDEATQDSDRGPVDPVEVVSPPTADVKSLFSKTKRKIKPSTISTLPPPPPVPAPKISSGTSSSQDEGWEREYLKLDQYLTTHGLHIEKVEADGSCLFSSIARHFVDVSGDELRQEAVDYMISHEDDFTPFLDLEMYPSGFADYCARMRKPGTWGSQLELQALSQSRSVNVYVFQTGDKATVKMVNFEDSVTQCVTVSYHDGEHYNCVLASADTAEAPLTVERLEQMLNPPVTVEPIVKVPIRAKKKAGLFN